MADEYEIWVPPNAEMRDRGTVPATSVEMLKHVKGYLVPRYIEYLPDGRRVAELTEKDLGRVEDGYACGECLAFFDYAFDNCPSCGHDLNPSVDIVDYRPEHWQPSTARTSQEILGSNN